MTAKDLINYLPTLVMVGSLAVGIGVFKGDVNSLKKDIEELKANQTDTQLAALKVEVEHLKRSNREDDEDFDEDIKELKQLMREDQVKYREQWRKFGQHMDAHM